MNKQELEKLFDEEFEWEWTPEEMKEFIFKTVIQDVLKSLVITEKGVFDYSLLLKKKAKELYDIDL